MEEIQQAEEQDQIKNQVISVKQIKGVTIFDTNLKCKCKKCNKIINLELNFSGLKNVTKGRIEYFMVYCSDCNLHTQTSVKINDVKVDFEIN